MNWGENILEIAKLYRKELWHCEDVEAYLKVFANSDIRISIMILAYDTLVKTKQIPPIESLNVVEKGKIWEEAKRLSINESKPYVIRVSKALYCMGQFVQI